MADAKPTARPCVKTDTPIRLEQVTKRFGSLKVLEGLNLQIYRGQTTVIMGPSGTGKSVLLKHIIGLLKPDSGRVWFEQHCISELPERQLMPIRTRFGFLFQMSALFDSMTVGENVAFALREHTNKNPQEIRQIVAQKLALVGLPGLENKYPGDLSGGMRKRVALARAIALDPEVMLYDEPTTGLDPQRSDIINTLINRLREQLCVTSVVVTHDLVCAERVADRVVMLKAGRLRFDGSFAELQSCTDPEVVRFIRGQADQEELQHGEPLPSRGGGA